MNLKEFYSKNRVPIYLIFISLSVFGIVSLFYIDFSLIPDIQYPELIIVTYYPNATPEEVKNLVSNPVEQIALSLKGVKNINTISREGMSVVKVQYRWGENLDIAHIELREKMDLLKSYFPREVKRPIIINYEPSQDAIAGISVFSKTFDPRNLYLICKKDIKTFFEQTEGVANVTLQGGEKPEVRVLIDPEKLVKYNVGINEIKNILGFSNRGFPVGFFSDEKYEYLVRVNGEFSDYRELEDLVVKEEDKKLVFLKDLASIQYGNEEKESDILIDGEKALMLTIHKQPAFNILKVSRRIDERINEVNERYQGNILFQKVFDESTYIKDSLRELIIAMILGIVVTTFSVYFFLSSFKVSLLIILTIPLSITGTFIFMKIGGLSINLLTLGGFSLAIGMIVDNSVIVVTSVYGLLYKKNRSASYYRNLKSVMPAVFSATFTTIVVFFPVLFLSGILKIIFLQLSLIIIISLLFSLIAAVTLIPVMLDSLALKNPGVMIFIRMNSTIDSLYERVLFAVFKRKILFIFLLIFIVVLGGFSYSSIEKRFIESIPQNYFYLKIFIKQQVPFEYTSRFVNYVSEMIKKDNRVSKIIGMVGVDRKDANLNLDGIYGSNTAIFRIYTGEDGDAIYELIRSIREKLLVFTHVDFVMTIPDNPIQRLLSRSDFDVVIKVYDPSPENLAKGVGRIHEFLMDKGFASDIFSSYFMSNSEQSLILKRKEMSVFQVDAPFLSEFISSALSGLQVGSWEKDEYEIPILIRFEKDSFSSIGDILNFSIKNSVGKEIKLHELLYFEEVTAPYVILRENQGTYAKVEYNLKKMDRRGFSFSNSPDEKKQVEGFLKSGGFNFMYLDQFSLLKENYLELSLALFLAMFLEYLILASGFRSFSKPVLVIAMIPLSIPGVMLILYLLNSSLNINTFMSIIVLIGLLVNNAIMLFLEYQHGDVKDVEGIISASVKRLKPILITTLSTILALVPTLFTDNRIQVSLSATLILGLLYSTVVTLLYLPLFYNFFYVPRVGRK